MLLQIFLFAFLICNATASSAGPGSTTILTGNALVEAETVLRSSLEKLRTGSGPNYHLGRMNTATRQTVAGKLYRYDAQLVQSDGSTKDCKIDIWSRSWMENGVEVTFNCPGESKLIRKHNA